MCVSISGRLTVLHNIRIVLVAPQIPENIGLCARVLKNTSFSRLSLVTPRLSEKSFEVAKRARDILENAPVCNTVQEAVRKASFVVGTTRRRRKYSQVHDIRDILPLIVAHAKNQELCILFGKENFGLSSKETELCDSLMYIPADKTFPSFNLAVACGIVCYKIFEYILTVDEIDALSLAKKKDIETLFSFMEEASRSLPVKDAMRASAFVSLRRILARTQLTRNEAQLLKGICAPYINCASKKKRP